MNILKGCSVFPVIIPKDYNPKCLRAYSNHRKTKIHDFTCKFGKCCLKEFFSVNWTTVILFKVCLSLTWMGIRYVGSVIWKSFRKCQRTFGVAPSNSNNSLENFQDIPWQFILLLILCRLSLRLCLWELCECSWKYNTPRILWRKSNTIRMFENMYWQNPAISGH